MSASVQCQVKPLHRILVVDDDSDLRLLYTNALTKPGYQVDAVEDGVAAWEALQAYNYNLLITEHSLPKLNGVELVRKLRAARMDVPVVMAAVRLPTRDLALDPLLQLAAVLPKPFYISELLQTVRTVLHVTDSDLDQIGPQTNRPSQPSTVGLWLR